MVETPEEEVERAEWMAIISLCMERGVLRLWLWVVVAAPRSGDDELEDVVVDDGEGGSGDEDLSPFLGLDLDFRVPLVVFMESTGRATGPLESWPVLRAPPLKPLR